MWRKMALAVALVAIASTILVNIRAKNDRDRFIAQMWHEVNTSIKKMGRPERLFSARPERSALLVVDMQDAFCSPTGCLENPPARMIVNNINTLAKTCREQGVPVFWIKFAIKSDLSNAGLWPLFQPKSPIGEERAQPPYALTERGPEESLWGQLDVNRKEDYITRKNRYSAFIAGSSDLEKRLRAMNRDTIIVTGVGTNVCCESTARDAMMRDFRVIFVSDANATSDRMFHEMTLMNVKLFVGDVASTDKVVQELTATGLAR